MKRRLILVLILFFSIQIDAGVWTSKRMKIDDRLSNEIEEVLNLAVDLHEKRVDKKKVEASKVANSLETKLAEVKKLSDSMHNIKAVHITKILDSAYSAIQSFNSKKQTKGLKRFFKEVVQITQVFEVKKYKVFFCPTDRSLWLQKSSKAKNPVNLRYINCGKSV